MGINLKEEYMPRVARRNSQSKYHHIIVQGVNKSYIFKTAEFINKYKQIIIDRLNDANITILAYCIMSNHAHFLIFSDSWEEISKFMQRINTAYAQYYHKVNNCIGYVFRNRFYSQDIFGLKQLYVCLKYIHNNPVKAGICTSMNLYPFSSYNEFFKSFEIITETSVKLLFPNFKNWKRIFSFIHLQEIIEDLEFMDVKNTEISNFLLEIETKYNKSIVELKKDKYVLKEIIQMARKQTNVTIRELATLLNISKSVVGRICK